jgi:predicted DCC family thiol-disulfide oxidoreductase YuxK
MRRLTVLYDAACGFCVRCRHWLASQPQLVELEFLPAASRAASLRFPSLASGGRPEELVVVDDAGGVYRGADAWVMCLYALRDYREWSLRLAAPAWRPWARAVFEWVSRRRALLSRFLGLGPEPFPPPEACRPETCSPPTASRP